ncbi:hypothetical protein ABZS44_04540 [Micromonospora sediminicola]|uniref:hypothetical protein n=1 Tax=Micromonospora sediminicola TaxID=946078 RepID=UPI0033B64177
MEQLISPGSEETVELDLDQLAPGGEGRIGAGAVLLAATETQGPGRCPASRMRKGRVDG